MSPELPDSARSFRPNMHWRARIEKLLLDTWYPATHKRNAAAVLSLLLLPMAWLYAAIVKRRAFARCVPGFAGGARPDALVVVVGNITVGGTGKTPFLLRLANELQKRNIRFVILSRGYGGSHAAKSNLPRWVSVNDSATLVGDEPLALARAIAIERGDEPPAVMICRDRRRGLEAVLAERRTPDLRCDVILSDDGLQHYAMPRDIEFALVDGERGFGNARMLPAGPLREPVARLALCDRVVVNGEPNSELARVGAATMTVSIASVRALQTATAGVSSVAKGAGSADKEAARHLRDADSVIAIAALGNPRRFFRSVATLLESASPGATLHCRAFPDHHAFELEDFLAVKRALNPAGDAAKKVVFIVTSKDAVKCEDFAAGIPLPCLVAEAQVDIDNAVLQPVFDGLASLRRWRAAQSASTQANQVTGASR